MDDADDRIARTSTAELETMLRDSAGLISEIKAELERRRAQHEAIEGLDQLLAETRPRWSDITSFFSLVLEELRGRRRDR